MKSTVVDQYCRFGYRNQHYEMNKVYVSAIAYHYESVDLQSFGQLALVLWWSIFLPERRYHIKSNNGQCELEKWVYVSYNHTVGEVLIEVYFIFAFHFPYTRLVVFNNLSERNQYYLIKRFVKLIRYWWLWNKILFVDEID